MKGKKRYLLLFISFCFIIFVYFIFYTILFKCQNTSKIRCSPFILSFKFLCKSTISNRLPSTDNHRKAEFKSKKRKSYQIWSNELMGNNNHYHNISKNKSSYHKIKNTDDNLLSRNCRMNNCFNFERCKPGETIKIHVYPESSKVSHITISPTYRKILNIIESSIYYEPDPSKACLFITRYDYLDRDPLSPDFQKNLPLSLLLDNGRNHIVFNLYSGTWPDYYELDLSGFNPGYSILAKASYSYAHYRPGFDISIPLFSKNHPERGSSYSLTLPNGLLSEENSVSIENVNENLERNERKNLLVFKGKRYIHGIGSETRNTLHHLHNGEDILIYTTCKHGKKWKDLKDERCSHDNHEYEKYDYNALMSNSTFCLVPRGRRLGSFRFLEALSYGCIPVLLSNNWVKPFEGIIDWTEIVIDGDERSLLQLPEILRSLDWKTIEKMRSQAIGIYEAYFSSVERIVFSTIAILSERIESHLSLNTFLWNIVNPGFTSFIGAIWFDPSFSFNLSDYPGYRLSSNNYKDGYTAIVYLNKPIAQSTLFKFIKVISKSQYLSKLILLWALPIQQYSGLSKISRSVPIEIIKPEMKTINAKLYPYKSISTDAVLSIDIDTTITLEELDFAYIVWCSFPHRVVGFTARDHYYDDIKEKWVYTSKWANQYSIILLDAAFYHRYYNHLFTKYISSNLALKNSSYLNLQGHLFNLIEDDLCLDLIFNFLVSHITKESPIKVAQRKKTINGTIDLDNRMLSIDSLSSRQKCFSLLANNTFGYVPLIKSQMRFDPLLFKDSVSNFRKKYLKLEQFS